jgi:hypothetical protein
MTHHLHGTPHRITHALQERRKWWLVECADSLRLHVLNCGPAGAAAGAAGNVRQEASNPAEAEVLDTCKTSLKNLSLKHGKEVGTSASRHKVYARQSHSELLSVLECLAVLHSHLQR